MTVIAAVIDGDRVRMAADSLAIGRDDLHVPVQKILTVEHDDGATVIGVAGQVSLIPIAHRLIAETFGDDLDGWAQRLADEITTAGVEMGAKEDDDTLNGELLLGRGGRLWDISHHSAIPITLGYAAVGSGAATAIGVLWATDPQYADGAWCYSPRERAHMAVQAAAAHVAGIGGPITEAST